MLCQTVFETLLDDEIDAGRYLFEATLDKTAARETLPFAVTDED